MHELAKILRDRRFAAGALELYLPEVKVDLDRDGKVTGAHEVPHDESHQIIEEFMIAANVAVAVALADRGLPLLRRVHGEPDLLKLRAFAEFVSALGYNLTRYPSRPDLQALLSKVRGEPTEHAVNYALLRSLKQAEYSSLPQGHYALALEHYCHFTSPIRRYPDLVVHRVLEDGLFSNRPTKNGTGSERLVSSRSSNSPREAPVPFFPRHADELELEKLGKHCSFTERRAAQAERELIKAKLLAFMSERVGEEMEAVITGVEPFGLFCQGIEIPVEGMVHISALDSGDYYYHDPATFSLIGRRTGKQYRLGDRVRVCVAHVDVDRRQLDFRIVAMVSSAGRKKKSAAEEPAFTRNRKGAARGRGDERGNGRRTRKQGRSRRAAQSATRRTRRKKR
jgi:ribonuclease R